YTGTTMNGDPYTSDTAPSDAGTYMASASFSDINHTLSSGSATFTIQKATATVTQSPNYSAPYDGHDHTVTVTITGVGGAGDVLATDSVTRKNTGHSEATASISGLNNYNDVS